MKYQPYTHQDFFNIIRLVILKNKVVQIADKLNRPYEALLKVMQCKGITKREIVRLNKAGLGAFEIFELKFGHKAADGLKDWLDSIGCKYPERVLQAKKPMPRKKRKKKNLLQRLIAAFRG